jgi:predicted Zn-dependent peptidase
VTHPLIAIVCLAVSLAATLSQAPRRAQATGPGVLPVWNPTIHRTRLSNGLPVWVVEQHELPVVQLSLVIGTGTAAEAPELAGLASLTSAMLGEGAGTHSAVEIADALEEVVANLSASSSADASFLRLYVPVAGLATALPLMADVAQRPLFPPPQLDRVRRQRLATLRGVRDDPDSLAALTLARGLYGPTDRNALPQIGNARSLDALTSESLRAFHQVAYRPANATLIVVGDVTPDNVRPLLDTHFGRWGPEGTTRSTSAQVPAIRRPDRQVLLVDVPDAPQSRVLVGGVSATSPPTDFFPAQVLTAILRTRFGSSRHSTLGDFTAGVRVGLDRRRSAGPLAVATSVQAHKTADALAELLSELSGGPSSVSTDELTRAKTDAALEFSRTFEATGRISSRLQSLEALVVFDLPDNFYASYAQAIQAVSADDVRRVAAAYLHADHLVIAIVGDRTLIEPGLRARGLGMPTVVGIDELFAPGR